MTQHQKLKERSSKIITGGIRKMADVGNMIHVALTVADLERSIELREEL